jgi:metallo-beta-lactamase family protein
MKLHFLGAAQEVTGSLVVVETEEGTLLVDCGLYQGRREESRRRNRELPREAVKASGAILTHAHIDHSGSFPTLVKKGFAGTIWATPATRDLCAHMLRDAAFIQQADADYLNRKFAADPDHVPIEPLYDEQDAVHALDRFVAVPYHRAFNPLPKVTARFIDAGHILGSASIVLDVEERGKRRRLAFSGDLGRAGLPILRDPEHPEPPLDYLVMESTYGNRVHGDVAQMHADLERVVKETAARGGKVIVPAFAVGRTQELLFALSSLSRAGRLPSIPVFVDSPLATDVTSVFRFHPECFDAETRAYLDQHGDVFTFPELRFTNSRDESMRLNTLAGPAVIISASGMCEAGRILHHLRNNIEDPKNTVMIVGFMARHTLGRKLVERQRQVKIFGVERDLRARVEVLNAFSAHADRDDLLAYAVHSGAATRRVFLTHGEPEQQEPLRTAITGAGLTATAPARGEVAELD